MQLHLIVVWFRWKLRIYKNRGELLQAIGSKKSFINLHLAAFVTVFACNLVRAYVVVQFYPWFKFCFLLFLGMVMYDNEFQTKENKI